jgi:lipopolysaccharide O-acetyltransferase
MNKLIYFLHRILLKKKKNRQHTEIEKYNIELGENSFFDGTPMQINGAKYIKIGENSSIGRHAWLGAFDKYLNQVFQPQLIIGKNVRIGNYACITTIDKVEIEDGCLFSEYIYISDHAHGFDPTLNLSPKDQNLNSKGPVKIGKNCFLGYRACILPGVTLGCNCVVGANSVVTKSFPSYTMLAGVPAKIIKKFSFELNEWISIDQ